MKKILRGRKGEIGTSSDVTEGSDIKVPKLLDYIEISDPKAAKTAEVVRFMHDAKENDGLFYWLEGKIVERVTKASRSKRLKYSEVILVLKSFG